MRNENNLIIIENRKITVYALDDKTIWEVGRPSKGNNPDIKLHIPTVSRKHGKFQNMDGVWFYIDYKAKNGTIYKTKVVDTGLNGRIKPVIIEDGGTFVFGGEEADINRNRAVWGMFSTNNYGNNWRVVNVSQSQKLQFLSGDEIVNMNHPKIGTVLSNKDGIAICMEDCIYLDGDMDVKAC